jgi:hypothetical protein
MGLGRGRDRWHAGAVIVEAERLLTGKVCDIDDLGERPNPGWSPINILAHGVHADLLRISDDRVTRRPGSWAAVLGDLATELLRVTSGPSALVGLQRQVLVPLELQLLANAIPVPTTPAQLRALVLGALEEHPT